MPDSWWLKFKRAQQHMVELRRMARLYAKGNPYEIVRIRERKRQGNRWHYRLTFEPCDPMLVMVLGDFVHNLRSALDHVVVASSQPRYRKNASFPVTAHNLWATDSNGNYVHPDVERREEFQRAIRGLSDPAKAHIILAQPYQGSSPVSHVIGVLSRLENADKHRKPIAIGAGLKGGTITIHSRGVLQSTHHIPSNKLFYDNAEVLSFTVANRSIKESEVKVDASGTATIHIKVARVDGHKDVVELSLCPFVVKALDNVRFLLRTLERFVVR